MPILCNYYVTFRCNAFCEFCHFADHKSFRDTNLARLEDVVCNLPELSRLGVKFIDFTGGEPLLNSDLPAMLTEAKARGFLTSVTTNCLLYPGTAERLKGVVDLLHFSLDSADREQHDRIRGVKCFDKVIESIAIARSLGEKPDILFTVTDENYQQLPSVYDDISKKNGLVLLINPVFSYFGNEGLCTEALDHIEDFAKRSMTYTNKGFIRLRRDGGNDVHCPRCKAVSRVITISPDNEILLPCFHFHQLKVAVGRSLVNARKTEIVQQYQKMEGRFQFCEGCTINCYFEPSFAFPTNSYAVRAVASKIKYGYAKMVKQRKRLLI